MIWPYESGRVTAASGAHAYVAHRQPTQGWGRLKIGPQGCVFEELSRKEHNTENPEMLAPGVHAPEDLPNSVIESIIEIMRSEGVSIELR